jgi:Tol biopolymer transport system component
MRRSLTGIVSLAAMVVAMATSAGDDLRPPSLVLRQALPASGVDAMGRETGTVSANGRFVAFVSKSRLLPADTNGLDDIYVLDRQQSTLTLETRASDGSGSNGSSRHPRLSGDGARLVFSSSAANLTASRADCSPGSSPQGAKSQVFVKDRLVGTTRLLCEIIGRDIDGISARPAISDDGTSVAFEATGRPLVNDTTTGDARTTPHVRAWSRAVYVARLDTGAVERISVGEDDPRSTDGESCMPSLSGDGRHVAFVFVAGVDRGSRAPRPGPFPRPAAIYVRDTAARTTTCVSCTFGGGASSGTASHPQISADGRVIVFTWIVHRGSQWGRSDIAVYDHTSSSSTVITRRANGSSAHPALSASGRYIAFQSLASDLACHWPCLAGSVDENLLSDIYVLDRDTQRFKRVSGDVREWWTPSVGASLDGRGTVVVFSSRRPITPNDSTTDFDLFVQRLGES